MSDIQLIRSPFTLSNSQFPEDELIDIATDFYHSVPFYRSTPLTKLLNFASKYQLGTVYIKDVIALIHD